MAANKGVVGALLVTLGIDTAQFSEGMKKARTEAGGFASDLGGGFKAALGGMASEMLAGVSAVGALSLAFAKAKEAMDWADVLQEQADRIGVSAQALQELQYAAGESDVSLENLQMGLEALNGTLGAFKTGVGDAKVKKVFEYLDISQDQAARMNDASDLLPVIADRLAAVGSQAEQVQLAKKLGVEALLPLLKNGADGLEAFRSQAGALGLTLDNQTVKSLADMNHEVEVSQQRLDMGLKKAFLDLAPAQVTFNSLLADAATKWLPEYVKAMEWARLTEKAWMQGRFGDNAKKWIDSQKLDRAITAAPSVADMQKWAGVKPPVLPSGGGSGGGGSGRSGGASAKSMKDLGPVPKGMTAEEYRKLVEGWDKVPKTDAESFGTYRAGADELTKSGDLMVKNFKAAGESVDGLTAELPKMETAAEAAFNQVIAFGDEMADSLADAIVYGDDLGDSLARAMKRFAAEWIRAGIEDKLKALKNPSRSGGSGGWMQDLFGLFGGGDAATNAKFAAVSGLDITGITPVPGRASGGPVTAGQPYVVGEKRAELFVPNVSGRIVPRIPSALTDPANHVSASRDINISISGARGNSEIMQMVQAGVSSGLKAYDEALPQRVSYRQKRT